MPTHYAPVPESPLSLDELTKEWRNEKPVVSIVCPTYMHEEFITEALHGFLIQKTSFPFEILIRDDGSTDATPDIVRDFVGRYPGIIRAELSKDRLFPHVKSHDLLRARALGKYIAFCEGDDYWIDRNKLQRQFEFLERRPDFALCHHRALVREGSLVVADSAVPRSKLRDFSSRELQRSPWVQMLTIMYRNHQLPQHPHSDKFRNGDSFFLSTLSYWGKAGYLDGPPAGVYRQHETGVWSGQDPQTQAIMQANSFLWIAWWYQREDNKSVSRMFRRKALGAFRRAFPSRMNVLQRLRGKWRPLKRGMSSSVVTPTQNHH